MSQQTENQLLESILGRPAQDRNTPEGTKNKSYKEASAAESRMARPFHGDATPPVALQKESPAHRIVMLLRARGMSVRDIYTHLGGQVENNIPVSGTGMFSYQHLLTITKQPWFKAGVVSMLEEAGMDLVEAALEAEVLPSVEELVRLRDTAESESVRLNAANTLIDRIRGKATTKIEAKTTHAYEKVPTEAEAVDKELEKIERKLASGTN